MAENDLAYLAGIIDGEGCIDIPKQSKSTVRVPRTIRIVITNTSPILIDWLVHKFDGKAYERKKGNYKHRCWSVYWHCRKAEALLVEVLPYLKIKREQAELALSFQRLITSPRGIKGKRCSTIPEREAVIEAMHILNSGGKYDGVYPK